MNSVILTVYQKEYQIGRVVKGIVDNTLKPFEFVVVYDGCTDKSQQVVEGALRNSQVCDYRPIHTPDVNETKANNAGMKAATGDYFILVQDDMLITEFGWDTQILKPFKLWNDVFAVSARGAQSHSRFATETKPTYYKYYDATKEQNKNIFAIRGGVNRGPLALRADITRQLGYLDEIYAPLSRDTVDLCMKAYLEKGMVSGAYHVAWLNLQGTTSNKDYKKIFAKNWEIFYERYRRYFEEAWTEDREVCHS